MAGIDVTDECVAAYLKIWKRKARYIIFKANEDFTKTEVEAEGERAASFDDFKNAVPKDDARWLLIDFEYTEADGRKVGKTLLISYSPDSNPNATAKFVIPNSLGALKAKMDKINLDKQINCWDDINEDNLKSWFK